MRSAPRLAIELAWMHTMRAKPPWPESKINGLLFSGAPDLLVSITTLIKRPRLGRDRTPLPFIYFCSPEGWPVDADILDGIEHYLADSPRIPLVRVPGHASGPAAAPNTGESELDASLVALNRFLDNVVLLLAEKFPRVRALRFPHYALANWLIFLRQRVLAAPRTPTNSDATHSADRTAAKLGEELSQFIKDRFLGDRFVERAPDLAQDFPWPIQVASRVFPPLALLLVRLTWHPPRWFRKQQVGRVRPGRFLALASKFADANFDANAIDASAMKRMLVSAFLEDLRRSYRRTSILGAGRRRTSYPVLIISDADTGSPALDALHLIAEIRNSGRPGRKPGRPGRHLDDPVLVITRGSRIPAELDMSDSDSPANWPLNATEIDYAYDDVWSYQRDHSAVNRTSWLLPLRVPPKPAEDPPQIRSSITAVPRPFVTPVMAPLAAAVLLLGGLVTGYAQLDGSCGALPWEPHMSRVSGPGGSTQCVGMASARFRFFADTAALEDRGATPAVAAGLADVEQRIAAANDLILSGTVPHNTIVYLGILTPSDSRSLGSELEQLRGVATLQAESLAGAARPMRVLLANGGDALGSIQEAVSAIREGREREKIVAAIGLGISREETRRAAGELAGGRVPTVGTLLTATELATRTTQYYHQVAPTNAREAAVMAYYAVSRLKASQAVIYTSDDRGDIYSTDLAEQTLRSFVDRGVPASVEDYQATPDGTGSDIFSLGGEACALEASGGVAVYTGRAERLLEFLRGMRAQCDRNYPQVLLGDDVSRFDLKTSLREFPQLRVTYATFTSTLAWTATSCDGARAAVGFYAGYDQLFGTCPSSQDGSAAIAYDAAYVLHVAIQRAAGDATVKEVNGELVLNELNQMNGVRAVPGASGTIEFSPDYGNGRVPVDKAVLLLSTRAGEGTGVELLCGRLEGARVTPDPLCPSDRPRR